MNRARTAVFALLGLLALAGGVVASYPWPK
jgi:hypothetical protein